MVTHVGPDDRDSEVIVATYSQQSPTDNSKKWWLGNKKLRPQKSWGDRYYLHRYILY